MTDEKSTEGGVVANTKAAVVEEGKITAENKEQIERWKILAEKAQALLLEDKGLCRVVGAMLASRQLYAMALHDMDMRVDNMDIDDRERDELKEVFVSSAAKQASHPFDEQDLFQGMRETVIPWMEEVSKEHNEVELGRQREEYAASEQERRSRRVSIGLLYDQVMREDGTCEEVSSLDRERALVLAGWRPAVLWVINNILKDTTAVGSLSDPETPRQSVLLSREVPMQEDPRILAIGENAWANCAKSNTSWAKTFLGTYLDKLKDPLDLFVVTDLVHARKGHGFQSISSRANDAQKTLRKWTTKMGSAFVGGVLLESQKLPDLNSPDWEKLRLFTNLRGVSVEVNDDETYNILIGRFSRVENVPKKDVESFAGSDIITP
jgi:hypothetical protein